MKTTSNFSRPVSLLKAPTYCWLCLMASFLTLPGQVDHFAWAPISSPQRSGTPFPVTITAQDLNNNVAASFGSTVGLQLPVGVGGVVTIGTGTNTDYYPLGTYYHDQRTQVIYLAGEVGGACRITALALNVADLPGQTLTKFTIRLKHTPLNSYSSYAWEGSGWTVVYQANLTVSATGWRVFNFTTPFEYNGADNLMVDFSFNNSSYSYDGYCAYSLVSGVRTLMYQSDSLDGDPLLWSGTSPTPDGMYSAIPNVRLTRQFLARTDVFLSPTNTGNFTSGVWSGNLTLRGTAPDVVLRAVDAVGHDGMANPVTVLDTNDVALLVSATPNPVGALSNLTYTLRVMNAGPTDASGVRLTNTLAAGVSLVSAVSSQGSCTTNGQLVLCDLGTLTGGMTATATIVVTPTIANLALTNVALVVRNEADANPANNVVTNIVTVGPPGVNVADATVVEGNVGMTNASFALTLNAPSAQTVTVGYSTTNGAAMAGSDYVATSGVVTFAPGVTNQAITVPVIGDLAVESNEVFYVNLSSVTNGVLATNRAAGTIINDDGLPGQVHHFGWAPISSPQRSGTPFPVTITAQDLSNNVAASFGGTVGLQLPVGVGGDVTIGTGNGDAYFPLNTYYEDLRTQVIYLAGEVGGACRITALALNVTDLPGQTLNNWTIRLKHTPLNSYSSYAWEGSGWTVVYQANLTVNATGWRVFNFTTPFEYNGADNLMVDFSFNNSSSSDDLGFCAFSWVTEVRTLTYYTDSLYGDPLLWSGTSNPSPFTYSAIPNVLLTRQFLARTNVFLSPTNTGNFTNGVWSGDLTLTGTAPDVVLRAVDAVGHDGMANPLTVLDTDDVALLVSATPNPVGASSNLTYTLRVMNAGPTDATGVRVTNILAAGVSLVSAVSSQGSCTTNGQLVLCDLGTLAGGMTATATIVVTPTIANLVLTNVASVVRNEADANPANNVVTNLAVVAPPVVRIGSTSVVEGNVGTTNAVFAAGLSAPSAQTVTVGYSTANGTALTGSDYVATNGVVMFAPGETNQAITVPVIGDIAVESNEVFYVNLSSVTNGVLATNRAAGTIINDDGLPGQVDHLVWAPISSPQRSGTPFPVTITAKDLSNNVAMSFGGTVSLQLPVGVGGVVTVGTSNGAANYPLGTYYEDQRTQVIYLAGEIGGACRVTALALNVTSIPSKTMTKFTIRLKHTPLNSYSSYAWEGSGWTVVYQANVTVSATGWRVFNFTTPFDYNGADNLMVDFSFNNSSYLYPDGYCASSLVAGVRTLTYHSDSLDGDPLLWNGSSPTPRIVDSAIPNVRLTCQALGHTNVFVLPTNTGNFINGVWSGNLTLTGTATNVVLRAMDSGGHSGASNPFDLSPSLSALRFDSSRSGLLFTNGGFRLGLTGCSESGLVVIYASTNLVNWFPLCTNPPVAGTVEFVDFGCTNRSASFYRAEQR